MAAASAFPLSLAVVFRLGIFLFFLSSIVSGDDVSRAAPSNESTACGNDFRLAKVKRWVNGVEKEAIGGLTADLGYILPSKAKLGQRLPATYADPLNGFSLSSLKDCDLLRA